MASRIVLVTGGARSGKSRYAEERAREIGARLLYVATAEAGDEEMARRIAAHRACRGAAWTTIGAPIAIPNALGDDISVGRAVEEFIAAARSFDAPLFIVTNEVGAGIVPDNPLARAFRDLAGRTNQRLAAAAEEVVLMVAGLPLFVKGERACD